MSDVKKIATRESYGNALVELGKEHEDLVVLDADLAAATKTAMFQKFSLSVILTAALRNVIWLAWQRDLRQREWFRLPVRLPCLRQDVPLSRFVTL